MGYGADYDATLSSVELLAKFDACVQEQVTAAPVFVLLY